MPARKPGKLPWERVTEAYDLEYGTDALECHRDGLAPGSRVLVVDDVLATGGTAEAAGQLARKLGSEVRGLEFLLEIGLARRPESPQRRPQPGAGGGLEGPGAGFAPEPANRASLQAAEHGGRRHPAPVAQMDRAAVS